MDLDEAQRRFRALAVEIHGLQQDQNLLRADVTGAFASTADGRVVNPPEKILLRFEAIDVRMAKVRSEIDDIVDGIGPRRG